MDGGDYIRTHKNTSASISTFYSDKEWRHKHKYKILANGEQLSLTHRNIIRPYITSRPQNKNLLNFYNGQYVYVLKKKKYNIY